MIRSKGEAGTGNVVEAVRHMREITCGIKRLAQLGSRGAAGAAKEHQAPLEVVHEVAERGRLPVPLFCAGGIATPADAALMMQLGAEGNFVGSGIFKCGDPERRAKAIVEATTHFNDPERVAAASIGLGERDAGARDRRPRGCRRAAPRPRCLSCASACSPSREASKRTVTCCASWARKSRKCAFQRDLEDLDGLVIPGGESTTISMGISSAGWRSRSAPMRDAGRHDLRHLRRDDRLRPRAPRPDRRRRRPQRLRPPAAELRGGPRDRGDRRRAAARRLHPRSLDRGPRRWGRGARLLRGSPGGDPRGRACLPAPSTPS